MELEIHPDALTERAQVIEAIHPFIRPVVDSVLTGGPAARAGVQPRDSIIGLAGLPIRQWRDLQQIVDARPGQPVKLAVVRGGQPLDFDLTLDSAKVAGPK